MGQKPGGQRAEGRGKEGMSTPEADPSSQTSGPKISLGAGSRTNLHFLGGLSSGLLSAVLLQPADLLKTRVQQHRSTSLARVVRTILGEPSPLRQLWRGTLPSALRTGVGSALYFTALNNLRQRVARREMREVCQVGDLPDATPVVLVGQLLEGKPPNDSELVLEPVKPLTSTSSSSSSSSSSHLPRISHAANLLTGAVARASVGFVMMPVTVIKVRYESNLYAYRSLWGACTDIIRHDGLRGFFAGFGTTAVRDAPYAGLYVLFYEGSKKQLSRWAGAPTSSSSSSRDPSPSREPSITSSSSPPPSSTTSTSLRSSLSASINFTSGVVAAVLATSLTNPFDAIKTRLQLFPARYTNMLQAGRRMMREEGVRALFDGLGLRVARKALSSAITWTIYEEIVRRGVLSREGEL